MASRGLVAAGVFVPGGGHGTWGAAGEGATREAAHAAEEFARRAHRLGLERTAALAAAAQALRAVYGDDQP
jgi:hypothetical protein